MKDPGRSVVRHRSRYRRHRRKNGSTRFLVVLLFFAAAAITWQFARQPSLSGLSYASPVTNPSGLNEPDGQGLKTPAYSSYNTSDSGRPTYRYSVISGGIASAEDLRQAMQNDPVVAREFEGFDFQRAHLVQVSEKQLLHLAYRMGDKIYWTQKKIALHQGETLISDGKIVARTRCGNRVAAAPLGPPAMVEPVESDFNQPLFSNDMVTHEVEPQLEKIPEALPPAADTPPPVTPKKAIPFFVPPFYVPESGSTPAPPPSSHSFHTPLAVAPEPGTLLLLSSGLAGVYLKARKSRRKP